MPDNSTSNDLHSPDAPAVGLTDDAFLGGRLRIRQPASGYRAGLDAVLLAAAAELPDGRGRRVLDAGAGVGVVGLALAARLPDADVTLVEREPELVRIAAENIALNRLDGRVRVVAADIASGGAALHASDRPDALKPGSFDCLVTNPPYYAEDSGTAAASALKRASHQMPAEALDRWLAFLATAAATGAILTLIHRADALAAILAALDGRFGRIRITGVHPRQATPAHRVIVSAVKASRAPLELRPGLVLHEPDGRYRPEIEAVLRDGASLPLD